MTRKAIALIATSFVVGTIATSALAASKQTIATADRDVRQLLSLMDKDQNGVVSRDEFLAFMGQTFDRLDANKSGTLETRELRPMRSRRWWPSQDCEHVAFPECRGTGGQ
jgi:Ca2+-binding EF-hand superfamily protein